MQMYISGIHINIIKLVFPTATTTNTFCLFLLSVQLDLVIDNLPTLSGQFLCAFTALDKTLITNATKKNYGVNCTTPRTDLLPPIPVGQRNNAQLEFAFHFYKQHLLFYFRSLHGEALSADAIRTRFCGNKLYIL